MTRRDSLIRTMKTNPLAPYVIRSIDVGSEPLFDCECRLFSDFSKHPTHAYWTQMYVDSFQSEAGEF